MDIGNKHETPVQEGSFTWLPSGQEYVIWQWSSFEVYALGGALLRTIEYRKPLGGIEWHRSWASNGKVAFDFNAWCET